MARDLWSFVLCLYGLQWVMPKRVVDLIAYWPIGRGCLLGTIMVIFGMQSLCVMWIIWKEQNNWTFEVLE